MRSNAPDESEADTAERVARWRAEQRVERWHTNRLTLRAVAFPIFAAEGWSAQIRGSASHDDVLTELTIAHFDVEDADLFDHKPRIEVVTSTDQHNRAELTIARHQLQQWISDDIGQPHAPGRSDAAITLWFAGVDRRRRAAALSAIRSETHIMIDGSPAPFLRLTTAAGRWVATRRHKDLTVTIAAHDLNPATISIEPISDPAVTLLGPEPQ